MDEIDSQNLENPRNKYTKIFDPTDPRPTQIIFTEQYHEILAFLRSKYPPKSKIKETLREIVL